MQLFDAAMHEPASETRWDAARAEEVADRIASDTAAAWERDGIRAAPINSPGRHESSTTRSGPEQPGPAGRSHDWCAMLTKVGCCRIPLARRADECSGLMHGEVGVLLVSWKLEPTPEKQERLFDLVAANARNPSHELFDGSPGTMLPPSTSTSRRVTTAGASSGWRVRMCCSSSFAPTRSMDVASGSSTAAAGSSGASAPATGSPLTSTRSFAAERCSARSVSPKCRVPPARRLPRWPLRDGGLVNWPTAADPSGRQPSQFGSSGVTAPPGSSRISRRSRDDRRDRLPAWSSGGELVWHAGPLRKGAGLCHGTAGNGCAFLALHARTGEERWLDRARAFAMHALEQVEQSEPRHSLWTGDIGVALYLRACVDGWDGHARARSSLASAGLSPRQRAEARGRARRARAGRGSSRPRRRSRDRRQAAPSRARRAPLIEQVEEADPGPHLGIEVRGGPPPESEPEAVDAVVRDGHRLDRRRAPTASS